MTEELTQKVCTPCRGGVPPLARDEAARYLGLVQGWELLDDARRIRRTWRFGDFRAALAFVRDVGELAEAEGHHPEVCFGWAYDTVSLQTKKIDGLHENDVVMAANAAARTASGWRRLPGRPRRPETRPSAPRVR